MVLFESAATEAELPPPTPDHQDGRLGWGSWGGAPPAPPMFADLQAARSPHPEPSKGALGHALARIFQITNVPATFGYSAK